VPGDGNGVNGQAETGKSALQILPDAISAHRNEMRDTIIEQRNVICELRDVVSKQQDTFQELHHQHQEYQRHNWSYPSIPFQGACYKHQELDVLVVLHS
jgi:hypothetical protein